MLSSSQSIGFVATSNADNARKYYEQTLRLEFIHGDQFALVFKAHETMLRIQIVKSVEPHRYTAFGWNVVDISKEVAELESRGVKFERYEGMNQDRDGVWLSPAGAKVAWFKDPDGNILSLTQF